MFEVKKSKSSKSSKNFKSGVTFSVVMVAIVIMLIVISTATTIGTRAISTANFEEYKSEIGRVSDNINEYYIKNKVLPVTNEVIDVNTASDSLKNEIMKNGDIDSSIYVVDISLITDVSIKNGKGNILSKDVYLVSDKTQNVYYFNGFKYNGTVYHSF